MKYDLHMHTKYSLCAVTRPEDTVRTAKKLGLSGIAVTDHNTMKGAFQAKKEAAKHKDFEFILAEEIKTDMGEVLGYYLSEEIKKGRIMDVIDKIKQQGGLAGLPHPYSRGIIRKSIGFNTEEKTFKEILKKIDFIETFNGRTSTKENNLAKEIAEDLKKSQTGGSDAHFKWEIGRGYTIAKKDLRKSILSNKTSVGGNNSFYMAPRLISFGVRRIKKLFV